MNVFEAVKQSVTTRQAAEHYGIHAGRNGMASFGTYYYNSCADRKQEHPLHRPAGCDKIKQNLITLCMKTTLDRIPG